MYSLVPRLASGSLGTDQTVHKTGANESHWQWSSARQDARCHRPIFIQTCKWESSLWQVPPIVTGCILIPS